MKRTYFPKPASKATSETWQASSGQISVPIWPGAVPDAISTEKAESVATVGTFESSIHVTKQTPPTFLAQAWDEPADPICNSVLYDQALDHAGVPAGVHLFAKADTPSYLGIRNIRSRRGVAR